MACKLRTCMHSFACKWTLFRGSIVNLFLSFYEDDKLAVKILKGKYFRVCSMWGVMCSVYFFE